MYLYSKSFPHIRIDRANFILRLAEKLSGVPYRSPLSLETIASRLVVLEQDNLTGYPKFTRKQQQKLIRVKAALRKIERALGYHVVSGDPFVE